MARTAAGNRTIAGTRSLATRNTIATTFIKNGNFEIVPTFVAATTGANVWIDGTAAGTSAPTDAAWFMTRNVATFSVQFDTTTFHSGTASLKLSCVDVTGRGIARTTIGGSASTNTRYGIPVTPSATYVISAWIKTNNAASGAVNGQWIRFDSTGTAIGSNFTLFGTNNGTQAFTLRSTTVTVGASDTFMELRLQNNVAGNISDAWFDDITIVQTSPIVTRSAS